ncbi:MAG: hypothetical protein OES13_06500, partial [Acidimicrobiia bacterium]|nr:hypothetical protein [Acidimicrobiia bacterium]
AERDPLRSLMESPLTDEEPSRERPGGLAMMLGAAAVGGLLVLGGYLLAADDEPPPAAVASTVEAPTTTTATQAAGFPPDYVQVNDRVAVRAERVLIRDPIVFVSLSQAVLAGLDGEETAGFGAGEWTLRAAGSDFPMLAEFRNVGAPGTFTIAFDAPGVGATLPESIVLSGEGILQGGSDELFSLDAPNGLPLAVAPEAMEVNLGDGVALVVDEILLDGDGGHISWSLEGVSPGGAVVNALVDLLVRDPVTPAAFMPPSDPADFLAFFGSTGALPSPRRSGVIELAAPIADTSLLADFAYGGPEDVTGVRIQWTIDWLSFTPADATVPLEGVTTIVVDS